MEPELIGFRGKPVKSTHVPCITECLSAIVEVGSTWYLGTCIRLKSHRMWPTRGRCRQPQQLFK